MKTSFSNNEKLHEFTIIIERDSAQIDGDLDTFLADLDTKKSNSDTDSDTFLADLDTKKCNSDTLKADSDTNSDTFRQDSDTNSDTNSDTFQPDLDTKKVNSDTPRNNSDTLERILLSKKQMDIVNYCSIPRTSREILERAGVSYHTKNIEKYINTLVNAGYLEMTNPENPNASNQKYRKKLK